MEEEHDKYGYKYRLKEYGTKEDVIKRAVSAVNFHCCSPKTSLQIYNCWGECILCLECGKVTEEGVADAMGGVSGSIYLYYKTYEDFLHKNSYNEKNNQYFTHSREPTTK